MDKRENIILLNIPGNEDFTMKLAEKLNRRLINAEIGKTDLHTFPDGESCVRILSDVKDKMIVLVCTLHQPNENFLPLYFLAKTARKFGAKHVYLVAPYLAYMRQDKAFNPGEGITSEYFGELISSLADGLVTVDPHLHRHASLAEIFSIPAQCVHATGHISNWIKKNVERPVLIGPDSESRQWVTKVARAAEAPFIILQKIRRGDRKVEISLPELAVYRDHRPVLVDDIISTAGTMIETIHRLNEQGLRRPVCIGVHAVFAGAAFENLLNAGVKEIVTCNTITHPSNGIDVSDLFIDFINRLSR